MIFFLLYKGTQAISDQNASLTLYLIRQEKFQLQPPHFSLQQEEKVQNAHIQQKNWTTSLNRNKKI